MSKVANFAKSSIYALFGRIPQTALGKLEEKAQFFQGKGWGAATTNAEVAAIIQLLDRNAAANPIAFDIGANVGNWTNSFLSLVPKCQVVAFEPSESAFKVLNSRFQKYSNVKCINLGLSDRNAEVILFSDSEASGLSSIHNRRLDHFSIAFNKQETINVMTLDSWIQLNPEFSDVVILKLDVEGHELSVLIGAKEVLNRVQIIQFEFGGGNIDSKTYFQDFWYFFTDLEFDLFRLTPRGPIKVVNYSEMLEVFRPTNYLAVRR